jgi:LysM repeat protein
MLAHLFGRCKHLFVQALTRTPVRVSFSIELMFGQDTVRYAYPRPQRRRGWGRIVLLALVLMVASARFAYGSGPVATDRVVVAPGDTVWSIAANHFSGDPRPHVDEIMARNHLSSPVLVPGESLLVPRQ